MLENETRTSFQCGQALTIIISLTTSVLSLYNRFQRKLMNEYVTEIVSLNKQYNMVDNDYLLTKLIFE